MIHDELTKSLLVTTDSWEVFPVAGVLGTNVV